MTVLAFRFFYVIGPALAVWAVIISVIGFTRPDFPRGVGAMRVVIGLTLAIMLTVVLSAMIGAKFEKSEIKANPGEKSAAGG
ncbi:MAG: hypothetical protein QOG41_789 [Thermoleophilaceae bacterium]|nr:hypothetical protein [Thermoleophilaceae bacterium]MEA2350616.1 hypothetical protein [Thermoleophilaceae bacterium]MEA2353013.1 hypothetical protein [Thermoleophilaceae bacterium]MEA2367291.1 hypothetical protein [Thermoleophilaceae bacterium]MEA2388016.1 hypothetical protein [Thermoleophilaceae bacterium]